MLHSITKYLSLVVRRLKDNISNYSFGSTSAVITSLAIIISCDTNNVSKIGVIGSLLVIALADNISDSLGIHIYQEGELMPLRKVWKSTFINFFARILVISTFIFCVVVFPPMVAIILSLLYGFSVLTILSYLIAKKRNLKPSKTIVHHLAITIGVLILSKGVSFLIQHLL